ncbi:MAG: hypothetical protein RLY71_3603 [Pseudomonadota bacterium]|jgi:hypothetical protein
MVLEIFKCVQIFTFGFFLGASVSTVPEGLAMVGIVIGRQV